MGQILTPATIEIYLCDPTGVRIECLDYITEYEYSKIANDLAPFAFKLPSKLDKRKISLDCIVEIWRGFGPGTLRWDYSGFLRDWEFGDDAGLDYTMLYGYSPNYLLDGRIVDNYIGSPQADMTGYADDLIKAIAKDQLGADAIVARDLTAVGGGVTIQTDLSDGQSITKSFQYKNVLEVFQEIAEQSAQVGTKVYFDIVPIISSSTTGMVAFQLQTFTDQRGDDRTWDSSRPVFIGKEWGNFQNGLAGEYHSDERNYCYTLGQGVGASQVYGAGGDIPRMGKSIWNRREGSKNASNVPYGVTILPEQQVFLAENKPKFKFGGDIVETTAFRYKRDWDHGDRVVAIYADMQKDAMIDKVLIRGNNSGETITAKIEIDE